MAFVKSKGTALAKQVSNAYVVITQLISLKLPKMEATSYEADTLDNNSAGIPHKPTGRSEGGEVSGEGFMDPTSTTFGYLTALITTPASANWQIQFNPTDTNNKTWSFAHAGLSVDGTAALNEGLKFAFTMKIDGLPTGI
jgi:hypothetical protein